MAGVTSYCMLGGKVYTADKTVLRMTNDGDDTRYAVQDA